jgi:hypothetical protein
LTCASCNQRRSNYFDPFARSMPPVIYPCSDEDGFGEVRAWCAQHKHWLNVHADYAQEHELGLRIFQQATFSRWLAGALSEALAGIGEPQ